MANSSLVAYAKISPNKSSPRNHVIDTITIHCTAGQMTAESLGRHFANPKIKASCNYAIDKHGKVVLIVDEKDRSWCSSNAANDNRAITIECSSDSKPPYKISTTVYSSLILLLEDICRRNPSIGRLKWEGDRKLIGQVNRQNMTVHRWFANKSCPGDYIYSRLGTIAGDVNALLAKSPRQPTPTQVQLYGDKFKPYTVKTKSIVLNVRKEPSVTAPITDIIRKPGIYTIVDEKTVNGVKWGKLKSGIGWICLKYAVKM